MLQQLEDVIIFDYPCDISKPSNTEVTIGDLHGNFMKLLYILVRLGIAEISEDNYKKLVTIYRSSPEALITEDLNNFDVILEEITYNYGYSIRLLGDELADRGSNDYFTLKLIQKLRENKVPLTILLSNHSIYFLYRYEHYLGYTLFNNDVMNNSMYNLGTLIRNQLLTVSDIDSIVGQHYYKTLKLIDYTLSEDKKNCVIYTHAPVGLEAIIKLAESLHILPVIPSVEEMKTLCDGLVEKTDLTELTFLIDQINQGLQCYLDSASITECTSISNTIDLDPIMYVLWNRDYRFLILPEKINQCSVTFVHGHDLQRPNTVNRISLDNLSGKSLSGCSVRSQLPIFVSKSLHAAHSNFNDPNFWSDLIDLNKQGQLLKLIQDDFLTPNRLMMKPLNTCFSMSILEMLFYYGHHEILGALTRFISPEMCASFLMQKNVYGVPFFIMLIKGQMATLLLGLVALPEHKLDAQIIVAENENEVITFLVNTPWQDRAKQVEVILSFINHGLLSEKLYIALKEGEVNNGATPTRSIGFFQQKSTAESPAHISTLQGATL